MHLLTSYVELAHGTLYKLGNPALCFKQFQYRHDICVFVVGRVWQQRSMRKINYKVDNGKTKSTNGKCSFKLEWPQFLPVFFRNVRLVHGTCASFAFVLITMPCL